MGMIEDRESEANPAMTDPAPTDAVQPGQRSETAAGADDRPAEKDPDQWVTGDEPMTGPQESYLQTLCQEAGEQFDPSLSKADASRRIEELQAKLPARGQD